MNHIDIIDEHLIIRETVGYEVLNQVPIEDMPKVMEFLKIVYNYNRMKRVVKEEEEPGWSDPMIEHLDREEKESEWQRRRRLQVMKEASMNPNPAHYESREITVEGIHKIHREMMEKERTDEMERTYGVVIDEIVDNKDFTGMDDNGNPTFRYKGIYYTLDKSFKKILEEKIERPPHWWWDALEPK